MKQLAMLVVAVIAITTQSHAATQHWFSGSCGWPSAVPQWYTVVEFNDAGVPIKAAGICCDGTSWSSDLMTYGGGGTGSTVNSTLHWSNDMVVSVSADQPVDFRVVDLRTGNYVSSAYHYSPTSGQLEINISTLSVGAYGVAVIQNGTTFNLLTFAKLQ